MCKHLPRLVILAAIAGLTGCTTPKHTNTLIFGTTTKFALDVSQEPTGAYGLTLGYRRIEAVWMPLLANERLSDSNAELVPSKCTTEDCRKFVGSTGDGGFAGANAVDTYSVLATLSGQTSGSAGGGEPGVKGGGAIAQVFATGIAARLLAVTGGAALVNTRADPPDAAAVAAITGEAKAKLIVEGDRIDVVLVCVQQADGNLDGAKYAALVKSATAAEPKVFTAGRVDILNGFKTGAQLRGYLFDTGGNMVSQLHAQVKTVCAKA